MKVGIESQRIFRKSKHGMDVVGLELIRQLQQLDKKNQYLLFAREGEDHECVTETANFKTVLLKGVTYGGWEQLSLPAAVKKHQPDILHCTANTAPYRVNVPMVVTIHDVIYLEETSFEGSVYQNFGNIYRKLIVPHAIKNAKKIITVSEYEKTVIADVCKTDPEKIAVIHNGVSERFHAKFTQNEIEYFRKQMQLPEQFILFLGNTAPKKNTAGAIKAYIYYCSIVNDPLPLVITDYPRSMVLALLSKINRSDLINYIVTPGYVPTAQMPLLYNCSSIFLYPSLRESFGLPLLEAMSCGIPVITSNIPSIREVAGDAAIFIDPEKPEQIAEAINTLMNDHTHKDLLMQKGFVRTSLFTWENAAKKLIKLYESI
jgi:glycosyltransferase involved in cell wall biosynthesis